MKAAIKDANILIDLAEADILGAWFQLGIETHTTELVLWEVLRANQAQIVSSFVDAGLLKIATLDPVQLARAQTTALASKVSIADASALLIAQKLKAMLLSGDSALREVSKRAGIEVHGVLWILDRLVESHFLTNRAAAKKLRRLMELRSFLPPDECKRRLMVWEG